MTLQQIHSLLAQRFGEAIGPWREPEAGDPCITVQPAALHEVCRFLKEDPALQFDFLRLLSAVDWTDRFATVYHLYSYALGHQAILRVDLPDRANPRQASVADLWPTADWHEREAFDLMGIVYEGHPNLRRIFMPEDWDGFPLRKDYQQPQEYHGIPNE